MSNSARLVRPFEAADELAVVNVWHRSGHAAYTYLPTWQTFTIEDARTIFRVGTLEQEIVAYLAVHGSYIGWMYVDPTEWRKGWGVRLVALAKDLSPDGLELHTHQENHAARALYEKQGFVAVRFGVSPPPESAPDVEYHWRPSNTRLQPSAAGDIMSRRG